MGSMIYAAPQRPSTAVPGIGDEHDDNIYSAGVLAHGGQGTAKLFVSPQGSAIPKVSGVSDAAWPDHYKTYSPLTTVLEKAGELGNVIGDATVRALGVTFDTAFAQGNITPQDADGVIPTYRAYGATPVEVAEILSKCYMEVKLSNKRRMIGPIWTFPQTGGFAGSAAIAGTLAPSANATFGIATNGSLPTGRRLQRQIVVARNDVLVCEIVASVALTFSITAAPGQPVLTWVNMISAVRSDVR